MTMVIIILIILLTECGHSIWGAARITPVSVSLHILAPTPPFTAGYLFLTSWLSLFNDWIHSHSESPKLTSTSSSNHQKKTIISSPELSSTSLTKLSSKVTQSSKPFSHICSPPFSQVITSFPTIPHFVWNPPSASGSSITIPLVCKNFPTSGELFIAPQLWHNTEHAPQKNSTIKSKKLQQQKLWHITSYIRFLTN